MKPSNPLSAFLLTVVFAALPLLKSQAQAPIQVPVSAPAHIHPLSTLREQAVEQQAWLESRLNRVLPALMNEYGIDMWILSMREYGEDPVFWSITSPTTFAARRRSIYVFTLQPDGTVERLALGGGSQGVVAMNLHTDTQHLGYVLKPGETEAPAGLQACLADSNRMQELLLEEMEPGRTGNEILAATLARISAEGITGMASGTGCSGARASFTWCGDMRYLCYIP